MWFGRTLELNLNWIQLKTLWKHFWLLTLRSEVMKIGNILYPPLFLNIGSRLRCQLLLWQQPVYKHQNKEGDNDLKREKGRHPPIHSTKVGKVSSLKFLGIHVSLHAVPCGDSERSSAAQLPEETIISHLTAQKHYREWPAAHQWTNQDISLGFWLTQQCLVTIPPIYHRRSPLSPLVSVSPGYYLLQSH